MFRSLAAALAAAALAGCAARPLPEIPTVPFEHWRYAETADVSLSGGAAALWGEIRAGQLRQATDTLMGLEAAAPGDATTLALAGFLDVRLGRLDDAEVRFGDAARADGASGLALLGGALLALERGDAEAAFPRLRRLAELAPDAPVVVDFLPDMTLDAAESRLTEARRLAADGASAGDVARGYEAALELVPDAGGLLVEAADAALAAGAPSTALGWYDEAARDAEGLETQLGIRLGAVDAALLAGDPDEAAARLGAVRSELEANRFPAMDERARALESRIERARLPAAYQRIRESERISREELAAVLAAELGSASASAPVIAIDIERSWAAGMIREAVAAGYLALFPDHTFQPRGLVSRAALAESLANALSVHDPDRYRAAGAASRERAFGDLAARHPQRDAAAIAVELGLLTARDGRFAPRDFASGAEAVRAVFALRDLLDLNRPG